MPTLERYDNPWEEVLLLNPSSRKGRKGGSKVAKKRGKGRRRRSRKFRVPVTVQGGGLLAVGRRRKIKGFKFVGSGKRGRKRGRKSRGRGRKVSSARRRAGLKAYRTRMAKRRGFSRRFKGYHRARKAAGAGYLTRKRGGTARRRRAAAKLRKQGYSIPLFDNPRGGRRMARRRRSRRRSRKDLDLDMDNPRGKRRRRRRFGRRRSRRGSRRGRRRSSRRRSRRSSRRGRRRSSVRRRRSRRYDNPRRHRARRYDNPKRGRRRSRGFSLLAVRDNPLAAIKSFPFKEAAVNGVFAGVGLLATKYLFGSKTFLPASIAQYGQGPGALPITVRNGTLFALGVLTYIFTKFRPAGLAMTTVAVANAASELASLSQVGTSLGFSDFGLPYSSFEELTTGTANQPSSLFHGMSGDIVYGGAQPYGSGMEGMGDSNFVLASGAPFGSGMEGVEQDVEDAVATYA